jgi:UPF0755 protein
MNNFKNRIKSLVKIKSLALMLVSFTAILILFTSASCGLLNPAVSTEIAKPSIAKGSEVEVEIKQGANLTQIAEMLAEKGIIDDAFVFRLYVQEQGKEKNLLPGTYRLIAGDEFKNILTIITAGEKQVIYKLTIPEGFTLNQIKERIIEDIPFVELQELESALDINTYKDSYEFLNDKTTLEGFLFPKTYDITVQYAAKNIIEMLITQYQLETQPLDWSYAADNNFSNYDILKIASLIEREAYIPDERPLISAVIYNRLKIDMILQIDASVRYALDKWDGIVTYDDLEVDSPYNTYKYTGLTPTPICNPGLAAIKAALAPADVDYLFYVVVDEKTHKHEFSKTFQEHVDATNQ